MGLIIVLVLLGLFFLVMELIFLPGVIFGTALSVVSYGVAAYLGFDRLGFVGGVVTVAIILLLSIVVTVLSLRAKTWQRLALKDEIKGASQATPSLDLKVGDHGTTLSRLSPMGNVQFGAKVYEAKSLDSYIDQRQEVEAVGFENFTVIVKRVN